jgi:hypothetical protein
MRMIMSCVQWKTFTIRTTAHYEQWRTLREILGGGAKHQIKHVENGGTTWIHREITDPENDHKITEFFKLLDEVFRPQIEQIDE